MLRNLIGWICGLFIATLLFPANAYAMEATYYDNKIEAEGFSNEKGLTDNNTDTYSKASENNKIIISSESGIGAVYIKFDRIPKKWTMTESESGQSILCGEHSFLHEFVDVKTLFEGLPKELVLTFEEGTVIADVYGFSEGEIPDWVQIWQPPCQVADLLLVSSHADDEQLFFLGLLPYYAGELGLNVQVAYVVQHFEAGGILDHKRPHEQLDGLWCVGVKHYPVMSEFPDLYSKSQDRKTALLDAKKVYANKGVTYDDFVEYMTECIRRFKPIVVVSHDLDGEYGHGTHVMAAAALTEAIEYASDETKYEDSAAEYGTWEIDKMYLHLYEENQIVMDYDKPLEKFGGKTAYQVSCEGFACHKSQHWTWFYKWIYGSEANPITKASQIKNYSPCKFGLYFTKVGLDKEGGDFFENTKTHKDCVNEKIEEVTKRLMETIDKTVRGVFLWKGLR